eukprot:278894-Alexandrium_andersonii.AAC.1
MQHQAPAPAVAVPDPPRALASPSAVGLGVCARPTPGGTDEPPQEDTNARDRGSAQPTPQPTDEAQASPQTFGAASTASE